MYEPDNEQLQAVVLATDLASEIEALSLIVNDETLGVKIQPLKIYCQKTGHIIGERDANSLFSLVKIHGKNAIISSLYAGTSLSTHPAWIETGNGGRNQPNKLDVLMEQDPIGYACYCFGLITAQFYQTAKNIDRKRLPWVERYWAMARANALLSQRGLSGLTELNIELCKLITYAPESLAQLFKEIRKFGHTPDKLALLAASGDLTKTLTYCINETLNAINDVARRVDKTRFLDYATSPADAARGPSNIRQQKVARKNIKEATLFNEITLMFKNEGIDLYSGIKENTPGTGAWKDKFRSNAKAKEAEMLADYQAIGGTNFDLDLSDDDEDNEVEVRTLALPVPEPKGYYEEATSFVSSNQPELGQLSDQHEPQSELIEQQSIIPEPMHDLSEIKSAIVAKIAPKPLTALEKLRARQTGQK